MKDFWYFGCEREGHSGHYLFTQFARTRGVLEDSRMGFPVHLLDGTFAPVVRTPGHWRLIVIRAGYEHLIILAGWDNTVDKRPGSNAAFISHGVLTVDEMLARAREIFPAQHKRLFVDNAAVVE